MEIAIMIEGQDGLNWPRWQRIAQAVEELGFAGLFRSDHFTNANPPDLDSLELWVSLTWLASHTQRIEFGPLVTPVSFRHPVFTARMASQVDDLSGGRLVLGVGAGWQKREHSHFGFDLLDVTGRLDRFEEGLEVISRLLQSDEPVDFEGDFYRLREAILLPRPQRPGGPPLLIGGNGPQRTLPLVARFANQWNGVFIAARRFGELNERLDELLAAQGRQAGEVRRTLMTEVVFGRDQGELERKLQNRDPADLAARGVVVGTGTQVVDRLGELAEAGVQRAMLQWLDQEDLDRMAAMADQVLPKVQGI
jgi:F420-dependent oxidoreductase-like protein